MIMLTISTTQNNESIAFKRAKQQECQQVGNMRSFKSRKIAKIPGENYSYLEFEQISLWV